MRAFRVLHLTDPHLFADRGASIYGVRTFDSFRAVLAAAMADAAAPPDAVLVTGDIGDDLSRAAYANFREAIADIRVPVLCLPGNHDDPALMTSMLSDGGLQSCGRSALGDWGLVMLDSHVDDAADGLVAPFELARLHADLTALADRPVLVCLHHPPFEVGSAWLDRLGLRNAAEVMDVLRGFRNVRAVLCGHVHQAFDAESAGLRLLATPSTCAQFTPRTLTAVMDERPPGWRRLELHPDGRLGTTVHWLEGWRVTAPPPDSRAAPFGMPP